MSAVKFMPASSDEAANVDLGLLRQVALERDQQAYERLFQRHERAAFNLALNITGNRELSEDALQTAMIRVWTSAAGFRGEGGASVRGWLLRIVARESLKQLREQRVKRNQIVRRLREFPVEDAAPAETGADVREEAAVLRRCLAELPEASRSLLALYYGGELSQEEIGKELRLPQSTVSRRLQDILQQLRGRLAQAGLQSALPMALPEALHAAVLDGQEPSGLVLDAVREKIRAGAVDLPAKSAHASPAVLALLGAAVMTAAGALWFMATRSTETQAAAAQPAAPAASAAEAPAAQTPPANAAQDAGKGEKFHRFWSFENGIPKGLFPDRLPPATPGEENPKPPPKIVGLKTVEKNGRRGLLLPPNMESHIAIGDELPGRPILVDAVVAEYQVPGKSRFGVVLSNGGVVCTGRRLFPTGPERDDWEMQPVERYRYYIIHPLIVATVGGQTRMIGDVPADSRPRNIMLHGRNMVIISVEMRELEPEEAEQHERAAREFLAKSGAGPAQ